MVVLGGVALYESEVPLGLLVIVEGRLLTCEERLPQRPRVLCHLSVAVSAVCRSRPSIILLLHPGGNPGENLKSISHRCYVREVASQLELTTETYLPLDCLQGVSICPWIVFRINFSSSLLLSLQVLQSP